MKCQICKSNKLSKIENVLGSYSKEKYSIKYCPKCKIGFTIKNTILGIKNLYKKNYDYEVHKHTKNEKLWRIGKTYSKISKKITLNSNSNILDIGCMYGFFLNFLKKKYKCKTLGLETESNYLEHKDNKENIIIEDFFNFVKKKRYQKKFDLIIMSHSLEHFDKPFKVLKLLKRLLKKEGKCLIIVPNFYSSLSYFFKSNWGWLQPSVHHFHFSKTSLRKIFKTQNYKINCELENGADSLFYLLTMFNIFRYIFRVNMKNKRNYVRNLIIRLFSRIFKYFYFIGNDELVYLVKKNNDSI